MLTINATLTAALAAGTGKPFIKAYVGYTSGTVKNSHTTVWKYILTGQTLEFWVPSIANIAGDQDSIWLERGLTIAGTDYTVTTSRFYIWEEEYLPNRVSRFKGGLVPRRYYSDAITTDDYEAVIDAFFTSFGKTTTYKTPAEAWLGYQFMPNPSTLTMTDATYMLDLLLQKRLIGCCDNGSQDVRVFSADVLGSVLGTIAVTDEFSIRTTKRRRRQYLWIEETGAYGQDGTVTDPVHNLGFQLAADSPPARNIQTYEVTAYVRPDFRWQDGDECKFTLYGATASVTFFGKFTEEYERSGKLPRWRLKIEAWPIYGNTEGGDIPDSVAARAAFAPVNVSNFTTLLSTNETNIQTALDILDKHTH